MELISREAAIEAITNYAKFLWDNYHETCNLAGMIDAIEALPTAEKVGNWIEVKNRWDGLEIRCSECGAQVPRDGWGNAMQCAYCPNCGARMVEGEENV